MLRIFIYLWYIGIPVQAFLIFFKGNKKETGETNKQKKLIDFYLMMSLGINLSIPL